MTLSRFDTLEREKIVDWSQKILWSEEGKKARKYLFDNRKISEDAAKTFKLGFVPSTNHQLSNRIIFPIYDTSDHLIALSTRLIDNEKSSLPIYWHEKYNKSLYLYGLNITKNRIRKTAFSIVLEGNFDVLTCYSHGLTNIVGALGHTLSKFHIALLLRYSDKIIIVFDNDENKAGQKGGEKLLSRMKDFQSRLDPDKEYKKQDSLNLLNIGFVEIPEQGDPDDFVRKHGILKFKKLIKIKRDLLNE